MRNPEWEQDRHQRRMRLMRIEGDLRRLERRRNVLIVLAVVLAVTAIVMGATL